MKTGKTIEILNYAARLYGQEDAKDLRVVGRSLWRKGYTLEEIASAYDVRVEDLRINTMTTEEAVKRLYKTGLNVENVAFVANKSVNWVYTQLNQGKNKQAGRNANNTRGFSNLGIAAKKAYV